MARQRTELTVDWFTCALCGELVCSLYAALDDEGEGYHQECAEELRNGFPEYKDEDYDG